MRQEETGRSADEPRTTNGRGEPVVDLHEPIYRELAEPRDGFEPPPTWLLFLCLLVMGFGGWYLGMYSGAFRPDVYDEAAGARAAVAEAAPAPALDPMVLGQRIYNNCTACHQRDGRGVAGNYPPLDGSEWVLERPVELAALVLHGLEGQIQVRGETYNQVMPKWSHLTDVQIAAVLTFVRSSWSNDADPISPDFVAAVRDQSSDRSRPWTVPDLLEFGSGFVVEFVGRVGEQEGESPAPPADPTAGS